MALAVLVLAIIQVGSAIVLFPVIIWVWVAKDFTTALPLTLFLVVVLNEGAMGLLNDLKAGGYKIVFMKPKDSLTTIASYDDWITKNVKGASNDTRPASSVIRTISGE